MESKYISIKEACQVFNKSLSTIRRVVKETPTNKIKKEKLSTGHDKIYIDKEYLYNHFNETPPNNDSLNSKVNDSLNNSSEQLLIKTFENIIKTLNNELEAKNKQIDAFLERQREANILIDNFSKKIALETKEVNEVRRKWWQRKK
jgi:hypothetical protein